MRAPKFKAQPTNVFFAAVNQMFGSSSQPPTMLSELCSTIWFDNRSLCSSWKQGGAAEHLIDSSEKRSWALNFGVCMLLKSAVISFHLHFSHYANFMLNLHAFSFEKCPLFVQQCFTWRDLKACITKRHIRTYVCVYVRVETYTYS